ncbi:hypothetical protein HBZS_118600 [Helicobacter bizzozeronii CCUG 35545]|nr:hypothetical protein HBZS_118600 [Helicobacter bizzozeronii CCUG 35545]
MEQNKQGTQQAQTIKRDQIGEGIKYFEVKGIKVPVIYEENHLLPMGAIKFMFMGGGEYHGQGQVWAFQIKC